MEGKWICEGEKKKLFVKERKLIREGEKKLFGERKLISEGERKKIIRKGEKIN